MLKLIRLLFFKDRQSEAERRAVEESLRDERSRQAFLEFAGPNGIKLFKQQRTLN